MQRRKRATWMASGLGAAALALTAWAGVAGAASGGGFNPDQQDCPWNADAWNTSSSAEPSGCHNFTVNVESGGTTDGDPSRRNTRFAEFGIDSLPNSSNNPSFGVEENVGDPGTPDSPHSGCLAINLDGTNGGTGAGCGSNPNGPGFLVKWDYYAVYCPATSMLPAALFPLPPPQSVPGVTSTPGLYQCTSTARPISVLQDNGNANALQTIATQGLLVYVGSFDNLDNGEHDGFSGNNSTDGAINGPSDGGALILSLTPQNLMQQPSATNPEGLVNASEGECADSICAEVTTQQQAVYYGCVKDPNSPPPEAAPTGGNDWKDVNCKGDPSATSSTQAYKNGTPASTQEAEGCNGGGPDSTETACYTNQDGFLNDNAPHGNSEDGGANAYRAGTPSTVYDEPGVQTYQDPDPQRSPALPFATPGLYVGTCGVYVNDGPGDQLPGIVNFASGGNVTQVQNGYLVEAPDPSCG
jgi:hypothetical protein